MNINVLCFNIHKGKGWHPRQSTIEQIQEKIIELNSDIIFIQEICGAQFEMLTKQIWPHFTYGKNAIYEAGHHGNAILSKFPIIFAQNTNISMHRYEKRGLLHSIVKIPGHAKPIHLFCVHLGLFAKDRQKQLDAIIEYIEANISQSEPFILGGDFNDWSQRATKHLQNKIKLNLQEAFLHSHGTYAKTYPAWAPVLTLDRLYFHGFDVRRVHRLIHKPWRSLSDHIALEVGLKLAV